MNRIILHSQSRSLLATPARRLIKSDLARQTVICAGLVGVGDALAQIYQNERDLKRLVDMTLAGTFLGPWYKWWYGVLNKRPNLTPLMKTGFDLSTAPFLHFTFLALYVLIHEKKIIDYERGVENMIELIKLDLLLFLPICYSNFKFIPPGIWQTVYINAMYVLFVEPVCSMIINDNVQIFDFFFNLLPQPAFEKFIEMIGIKPMLDLIIERTPGK